MAELDEARPYWDAATALMNLRTLLAYPQAIESFARHLDHVNAEERATMEHAAQLLFLTVRAVVDDTVPGAELLRTRAGQPVHRTPNCDLCASTSHGTRETR